MLLPFDTEDKFSKDIRARLNFSGAIQFPLFDVCARKLLKEQASYAVGGCPPQT